MVGFIRRAVGFVARPTQSRTMGLLIVLVLAAAVSLTVYVAQQQQQLKQRAAPPMTFTNPACAAIDDNISDCTFLANSSNPSCNKKGEQCRDGNTIYECQEQ